MALERISGNRGNDEKYVVVAKSGNVALGVYLRTVNDHYRPTIDGKRPISITGRVRIASAPGAEATEAEINEAFKQLPIEKFASEFQLRSSFSLGLFLNQVEKVAVGTAFDEQKVGFKLYDFLTLYIGSGDMLVTAEELHEALKTEIGATLEDAGINILSVATEIAAKDKSFGPSVDSVVGQLDKARHEASDVFKAACDVALAEAVATAEVLVAEYLKAHPDFTAARPETDPAEFKLLAFLYEGLDVMSGPTGDDFDEDSEYDA